MNKNYSNLNQNDKQLSFLKKDDGVFKEPIKNVVSNEIPLMKEDLLRDMKYAEYCIIIDLEELHYKIENAHKLWPDHQIRFEMIEDLNRDVRDNERELYKLREKINKLEMEMGTKIR